MALFNPSARLRSAPRFASALSLPLRSVRRSLLPVLGFLLLWPVSLFAAATTLNFSSDAGGSWSDGIANDGEGGSSDISGITIEILNISDTNGTNLVGTPIEWYNNTDLGFPSGGFTGLTTFSYPVGNSSWKGISIRGASGAEFQLNQFTWYDWGDFTRGTVNVIGYRNSSQVASTSFTSNTSSAIVTVNLDSTFDNVDEVRITYATVTGWPSINGIVIDSAVPAPTVTNANISISGASGTGGAFKINDTVTATWNNTAGGDNNSGITGVTVDFSQFGGGAAVTASNSSGTWTATYPIVAGAVDTTSRNVSVSATNAGGTTTTADTTNATVDNIAPTVTDGRISISGASGTGGAYKIGDTVTATWNNTAGGDNNSDTISSVSVNFSQFGGGAAVAASNSSGTWTATYTIVSGAIDTTSRNVSVTATDNAGNTTTTADTTNATVDNIAPTVTDARISISGASGTGGAYKTGDTVTATWNNTAGGDNNSDTISSVTVDFSQFGGGAAVSASNSSGTWTATYTLVSGAINGTTNRNISATATDNAGNATTTADTTNATVDNVDPTITFSSLAFSADTGTSSSDFITKTAAQTITATLSGAPAGSDIVYGSLDNGSTWTDITSKVSGTSLSWNGVTLTSSNTLRLRVTDAAGNNGSSASQAYTLDTSAPSAPSTPDMSSGTDSGSSSSDDITSNTTPTFTGTAEAGSTVTLYDTDGTTLLGSATATGGNWSITSSSLSAGSHTLTAKAADAAGNVSSASSGLSVTIDTTSPTVSSVSVPANGSYKAGDNLDFTVNFDENVTVNTGGGTPRIALTVGSSTVYASYLSGSGTSALVFRYTVQSGDADSNGITVGALGANGGTLQDSAGNNATLTLNSVGSTSSVLVDTTGPAVTSVSVPANDTYTVGENLDFTVNFDENVTVNTGGGTPRIALTVGSSTVYASYLSGSGTTALLFRYTVQAGNTDTDGIAVGALGTNGGTLKDAAGTDATLTLNSVGSTASVLVDTTAPTVSSILRQSPTTVNSAAASVTYRVTFSEGVTGVDTADFTATVLSGSATGTVSTVTPVSTSVYDVAVSPGGGQGQLRLDLNASGTGISDSAGNAISAGFTAGDFYYVGVESVFDTSAVTPNGFVVVAGGGTKVAQRFTATTGLTLTTATALVKSITSTPSPVVQILADNSGSPGATVVGTLTNPASLTANALNVWTGSVSLNASTTYWVVFSDASGGTSYEIRLSTVAASGGTGAWLTSPTDYKFYYGASLENSVNSVLRIALGAGSVPTNTIATAAFSADTGASSSDFITNTAAQTISGTLASNLASGDHVEVSLDNGSTWTPATASTGSNTWSLGGQTLTASNTLKVRVANSIGNGTAFSQAYVFDTTAPSAPNLSASKPAPTSSTINLSWDVPSSTSTFTLRRSTSAYPTSITDGTLVQDNIASSTTSYNDTSLSDATYYYGIFALDPAGNISNAGTATATVDTTPPSAPVLSASTPSPTGNTIDLSWTVPSTTATFTLRRSTSAYPTSIADGTLVQAGIASSTTTLSQTSLTDGIYYYALFALDAFGNVSNAGTASAAIDTTAPSAPTAFTAVSSGANVALSWTNPAADFASCTLRRSTSAYPTSVVDGTAVAVNLTGSSYNNNGLVDGTYYYALFALDNFGNVSVAATATVTVDTTPPAAPTLAASKPTANGSTIDLTWNVPSTTATFTLRRSTSAYPTSISDGTLVQAGIASSTTSLSETSLADATYYYAIFALDAAGNASSAGTANAVIDTTAPSAPTAFTAVATGVDVALSWTNPVADFASCTIRRSTSAYPASVNADTAVATGLTGTSFNDTSLAGGTYYYSLFALDAFGNVSVAATASVTTDAIPPTVVSVVRSASSFPTNAASVGFTVTFSEAVSGVDASDFVLATTGTASGSVASVTTTSTTVRQVVVGSLSGQGTIRLDVKSSGTGITDTAGNPLSGGYTAGEVYTIDRTVPAAFDLAGYLSRYPDIAALYAGDPYAAWVHYRDQGIYDGEVFDDEFRVEEYLELYPDLLAAYGTDLTGALMHWLTTGRTEGRLGRIPVAFDAQGYLDRNPDVAAAVGSSLTLAWQHFWLYGIYEGREYNDEFNAFEYLAINADLTAVYVDDWRAGTLHWLRYGRLEGRLGSIPQLFDVATYLTRNPDVAAVWGTNPTTVFLHFWLYGIDEGRTFDDEFRVDEYLALNPSLAAVYGTDRRGAFKHWVRYGRAEGRPGKNP